MYVQFASCVYGVRTVNQYMDIDALRKNIADDMGIRKINLVYKLVVKENFLHSSKVFSSTLNVLLVAVLFLAMYVALRNILPGNSSKDNPFLWQDVRTKV